MTIIVSYPLWERIFRNVTQPEANRLITYLSDLQEKYGEVGIKVEVQP